MKRVLIVAAVCCLAVIAIVLFGKQKTADTEDFVTENTNDYMESINDQDQVDSAETSDEETEEDQPAVIIYEEEIEIELEEGQAAGGG